MYTNTGDVRIEFDQPPSYTGIAFQWLFIHLSLLVFFIAQKERTKHIKRHVKLKSNLNVNTFATKLPVNRCKKNKNNNKLAKYKWIGCVFIWQEKYHPQIQQYISTNEFHIRNVVNQTAHNNIYMYTDI